MFSVFKCDRNNPPSDYTKGQCYDGKHIFWMFMAIIGLINLWYDYYLGQKVYISRNPFHKFPRSRMDSGFGYLEFIYSIFVPMVIVFDLQGHNR